MVISAALLIMVRKPKEYLLLLLLTPLLKNDSHNTRFLNPFNFPMAFRMNPVQFFRFPSNVLFEDQIYSFFSFSHYLALTHRKAS
jgi:hypothetical protein